MVMHTALVIILGSPASGKTSLAQCLATDLGIACLCKDDVKEALFDTFGVGDRNWSAQMRGASLAALLRIAARQVLAGLPSMVEGNWSGEDLPAFRAISCGIELPFAQVCCYAEPPEIDRRMRARQRHPGHLDALLTLELAQNPPLAPRFLDLPGPAWVYRSDQSGDYTEIRRSLETWLESGQSGPRPSI